MLYRRPVLPPLLELISCGEESGGVWEGGYWKGWHGKFVEWLGAGRRMGEEAEPFSEPLSQALQELGHYNDQCFLVALATVQ